MQVKSRTVPTVKAYLKLPIVYRKDGREILIPSGTVVLVDRIKGVALVDNDHVDIYPEEYKVIYQ